VSESTVTGEFGVLRVERDMIDVTSGLPRPDEAWRYTDRQGHGHYWRDGYPTLRTVLGGPYWCEDCHDEHQDSHLECPLCSETVQPGMVGPSPFREFIPGLTSYYLNDEPITEERAREILGKMRP
jgi:hypothetical protein